MISKRKNKTIGWFARAFLVLLFDVLVIFGSYYIAMLILNDFRFSIPWGWMEFYLRSIPFWCIGTVCVFFIFRLYHSLWSYVGTNEFRNLILAFIVLVPFYMLGAKYLKARLLLANLRAAYFVLGFLFSFLGSLSVRFGYRFLRNIRGFGRRENVRSAQENIMVIGAGSAGRSIIRELRDDPNFGGRIRCVIDDNPSKHGRHISGVEIVGDRYAIVKAVVKFDIDRIIFAIPSASAQERKDILHICKECGCRLQIAPGIHQLIDGEAKMGQLRDVEISDLLGREQIMVSNEECFSDITDKVVLVTGGGGSIGSELCRQIANAKPKKLVLLDIYENSAYEIQQELKRAYKDLDLTVLIGSVRNTARINGIMRDYRPDIVFHAAAHKHVPLMEDSPNEAIKNNVFGTYKTALAAERYGVGKFVLISTDKAVNPTNVMGATKRVCEMIVQMMDRRQSATCFVAVRFGNVLGSNGSVIPLFKKQIAQGGPITITDKRIIRYFMTITEAVSLVLQASHSAKGGEIFVLDMGEPVKIDDMARNLIRLSGLRPDVDIRIEYIGLRPGEKLYEELLMSEEGLSETENRLIHIGKPIEMDDSAFLKKIEELEKASREESGAILDMLAAIVPTYHCAKEKESPSM